MSKKSSVSKKESLIEKTLNTLAGRRKAPNAVFAALIITYIATSIFINKTSKSTAEVQILGGSLPYSSFAGIFSALANISIVFTVLYYGKKGFYTSLTLLLLQFPVMFSVIILRHNPAPLPGAFANILTIISSIIIYVNNKKIGKYQEKLRIQAITDRLTGLPNRFACTELVDELVKRNEKFAIVAIDVNSFKSINDTMGRNTGNSVLIEIAERWKSAVENEISGTLDFISRQGGDEFSLIIRNYHSDKDIVKTIKCYQSMLETRLTVDNCDLHITACFGYAVFPNDAQTPDALFSYADAAVSELKYHGGEHILRFTPDLLKIEHTIEIEREIREALEKDTLYFHLQPQYDIDHKLRGFEALARLNGSNGKNISPGEFIPVAEKVGIIDKVDGTVLRKSAKFFSELIKRTSTDATLSVNISVRHLMKNDFLDEIKQIVNDYAIPPQQLELEITESIMIDSAEKAIQSINAIRDMGIKIAIDDFGTGYSSLSYLNNFPANLLKIDKSFIDNMNSSESSKKYVAAIISIGHIMNFGVISEGVEESAQLETLRSIGCDYIQGYIWGKPMSPEDAEILVAKSVGLQQ